MTRAGIIPNASRRPSRCGPASHSSRNTSTWRAGRRPIDGKIQPALQRFGYVPPLAVPPREIVKAFQRHYRPAQVDGMPDAETLGLLGDLLDQVKNEV